MMSRIIVIALLATVLASLAAGMYFLVNDRGRGTRSGKALLVRAVLSTVVLIALVVAFGLGMLDPQTAG